MAFGDSLVSVLDRTKQVETKKEWPIGGLGDMKFDTTDSPVAVSILHIFEVSPLPDLMTTPWRIETDQADTTLDDALSCHIAFLHPPHTYI
jgi:hypothetical protein